MTLLAMQKWILGATLVTSVCAVGVACDSDSDSEGSGGFPNATGGAQNTGGGTADAGAPGTGGAPTGGAPQGGTGAGDLGPELVNAEGWVGGEPADRTDDPAGVQGSFYLYSDGITCNTEEGNPCTADGCCLDWATIVDGDFLSWGCGVGLELNSDGGEPATKSPYTAAQLVGFQVTVAGDVPKMRLGYTQLADTTDIVSPFALETSGAGTYDVLFSDTACPPWGAAQGCVDDAVATSSHDLQIQVVGGEAEASGQLCITSIRPLLAP